MAIVEAGAARIDITPSKDIWMAGMLRAHPSEGIHDPISACALVMSNDKDLNQSCAILSVDVCELDESLTSTVRSAAAQVGIPAEYVIIAAKHIHSGPVTIRGDEYAHVGQLEIEYTRKLADYLIKGIKVAAGNMKRVKAGCASGSERTISQYRRLLADDGHVVMNWEPYPREHIVKPLGEIDPEVGVLKVVDMDNRTVCLLFNHAGHPNILSGDNYLISAEYPGFAERVLEREFGGVAMFVNGAEGTMDIDGLGPRDWAEMERVGRKLAQAVAETAYSIEPAENVTLRCANIRYGLPARKISGGQLAWAEEIIRQTGGRIEPIADGVGDDFKAVLYKKLHEKQNRDIPVEQVCIALDDTALVSFPGELYTEIGMRIKGSSPFRRTYVLGLANDSVGYVPTAKAIREGGYSEDVRKVDVHADDVVLTQSLSLLNQVYRAGLSNRESQNHR
jgi:neutral ceramidase